VRCHTRAVQRINAELFRFLRRREKVGGFCGKQKGNKRIQKIKKSIIIFFKKKTVSMKINF
jgi:hypothetical protein